MLILRISRSVQVRSVTIAELAVQARWEIIRKEGRIGRKVKRRKSGRSRFAEPSRDRKGAVVLEAHADMRQQGRWRQLGVVSLAVLSLATGQGCLSFLHPVDAPPQERIALGEKIPAPCRSHVHVFLLQGLDPLDWANLYGLTEYIQQLGYNKTHYGQFFHMWEFRKEMRRIHKEEPQARFVVIGFSLGSFMAQELVNAVKKDGILIDLLVYVGGFILDNSPRSQPDNVARVVSILSMADGMIGPHMDRADNIRYGDVWHFGLPTHPHMRELLTRELAVVAGRVPFVEKVPPLPPELEEEIPRPRRLTPDQLREMSSQLPSEWSFLNSRSANGEPPPPRLARPGEKREVRRVPFAITP